MQTFQTNYISESKWEILHAQESCDFYGYVWQYGNNTRFATRYITDSLAMTEKNIISTQENSNCCTE